jgi:superfamily II DNA or RNA helicase
VEIFFDRGTILIEAAGPLPRQAPPGLRWDPRVSQWRAEGYRLPRITEWLKTTGIPYAYHTPRPTGFLPGLVPPERLPRLRPYQEEALQAWTAARRRGVVCLPTGSGKTRLAVRAILSLGRPALVVAPTRELVHQWAGAIKSFYPGPIGRYGDGEHGLEPITISTFESAYLHLDRIGDHFDVMVVDEAHHLPSTRWAEVGRMATAPFRLGLTATPPEMGTARETLEDLLGPVCFALPISSLSGSYLATFEVKLVAVRLDRDEQGEYDRLRGCFLSHYRPFFQQHPDAAWEDFVRAAYRSPAGREALQALRRSQKILGLPRAKLSAIDQLLDLHREEPMLIFTADNPSAYEVSRRFFVPAITCEIDREERRLVLGRFAEGTYRALVSAKVLNEGIDVPAASIAVVAGGSSSRVEHAQRIGRVLRPKAGKRAVVYELVTAGTGEWLTSERRNRSGVPWLPPAL